MIFKFLYNCIALDMTDREIKQPQTSYPSYLLSLSCDSTYNFKQHYSSRTGTIKSLYHKLLLFQQDIYLVWKNWG